MTVRDAALPIALDAMGGDHAPAQTVLGAALAVRELGIRVALVGRPDDIERELAALPAEHAGARGSLSVVAATQVVDMDEHPATAVRARKDASVVVACREVAAGRARAAVSAGNSGAVLAAALFGLSRVKGVARPAIGTLLPTATDAMTFMLDVGANADCRPEWLAQFGLMGSVYASEMMGVAEPRVALLSNGEERGKGNELVLAATPLLEAAALRFIGNIEGKDLFGGRADVVVCDGFSGNVALKVGEGVAEFLLGSISTIARQSLQGRVGGLLLKPRLRPIRDKVDYRTTGGALLLGVAGEVVIAHGRSDAVAVMNALRVADQAARRDVSGVIASRIAAARPVAEAAAPTPDTAATAEIPDTEVAST